MSVAGRSCDEWFGAGASSDDLLTTIVDLDVPEEFCSKYNLTAPCVYVHRSGPGAAATSRARPTRATATCASPTIAAPSTFRERAASTSTIASTR